MKLKAIDLFCGIGGFSSGLNQAGIDVVAAYDFNKHAVNTYNLNKKGHHRAMLCDITGLDFNQFKGIDIIIGGPPCQPFSAVNRVNKKLGEDDPRDMIPQFIRAVKEAEPKAFIMENVPALCSKKQIGYLNRTLATFIKLNYEVTCIILSAAELGLCSKRKRLFILGVHNSCMNPKQFNLEYTKELPPKSKEILPLPGDDHVYSAVYAKNPVVHKSFTSSLLVNGKGRPIDPEGLVQTILAFGGNSIPIYDPNLILKQYHHDLRLGKPPRTGIVQGVRRISINEALLIQDMPNFKLTGPKSAQWRQIGNTIPPKLAATASQILMRHIS